MIDEVEDVQSVMGIGTDDDLLNLALQMEANNQKKTDLRTTFNQIYILNH